MLEVPALRPTAMRRLRASEYDQLVALGVFADERVELLDGVLVTMSPQGKLHASVTVWLVRQLTLQLGLAYDVRPQVPLRLGVASKPEPDIAVTPVTSFARPEPTRALLVIEVADTSLALDRGVKASLYAAAAVPEYWVVDLSSRTVIVHTRPKGGRYQVRRRVARTAILTPTRLPGVALRVAEVVPPLRARQRRAR